MMGHEKRAFFIGEPRIHHESLSRPVRKAYVAGVKSRRPSHVIR